MEKQYFVYIMTNKNNTVLYTGTTNNLKRRVYQHKGNTINGFSRKYNIKKLVYYEITGNVNSAILREKKIKSGSRKKKIELINRFNPLWVNLYDKI